MGTYTAVNESGAPIASIVVTNGTKSIDEVTFDRPASKTVNDNELGFWIYTLATPLQPGEQIKIHFKCGYRESGIPQCE